MELDGDLVTDPTPLEGSPVVGEEVGGTPPAQPHRFITAREVWLGVIVAGSVLAVAAYLHTQFTDIRSAVHSNARDLAIVKTEITAMRRDIDRLEKHALLVEPDLYVNVASLETAYP